MKLACCWWWRWCHWSNWDLQLLFFSEMTEVLQLSKLLIRCDISSDFQVSNDHFSESLTQKPTHYFAENKTLRRPLNLPRAIWSLLYYKIIKKANHVRLFHFSIVLYRFSSTTSCTHCHISCCSMKNHLFSTKTNF
jgi:hypothetical protein